MPSLPCLGRRVLAAGVLLVPALSACGGGSGGAANTYTSVADDGGVLELKSGGAFAFTIPGLGTSQGTYTVDGEKVALTMNGQVHTLIKTGDCLEDQRHVFSRMCVGGKAGEAASAAAQPNPPSQEAPSGTWRATSQEGEFTLQFQSGNTLTFSATPTGGQPETRQGSFTTEGRLIHVRLGAEGDPLVLTFVNDAYETTSFGFPLRFVKQ